MLLDCLWDRMISVFIVIITLCIIAFTSLRFFFVCIGVFVVMFPIIRFFGKRTSVWRKKVKDITIEVDRMYVRWIMSKFEIQQQDKYLFEMQKRKEFNDRRYAHKYKEKQQQAFAYDTLVLSTEILLLVITWVVSIGILHGTYTISDFVLLT